MEQSPRPKAADKAAEGSISDLEASLLIASLLPIVGARRIVRAVSAFGDWLVDNIVEELKLMAASSSPNPSLDDQNKFAVDLNKHAENKVDLNASGPGPSSVNQVHSSGGQAGFEMDRPVDEKGGGMVTGRGAISDGSEAGTGVVGNPLASDLRELKDAIEEGKGQDTYGGSSFRRFIASLHRIEDGIEGVPPDEKEPFLDKLLEIVLPNVNGSYIMNNYPNLWKVLYARIKENREKWLGYIRKKAPDMEYVWFEWPEEGSI